MWHWSWEYYLVQPAGRLFLLFLFLFLCLICRLGRLRSSIGDPFSTSASTAGIISLGLQLSDGLIKYCRVYSSRDEDPLQLSTNAERLQSLLSLTKNHQQEAPVPNSELTNSLQECITASGICINDSKSIVRSMFVRRIIIVAWKNTATASYGNYVRYPFDKEKFEDLRLKPREFNESLVAHLQLMNLLVIVNPIASYHN